MNGVLFLSEILPASFCDDHLRPELVELLPQRLHLQLGLGGGQSVMQRLLPLPLHPLPPLLLPHLVAVHVLHLAVVPHLPLLTVVPLPPAHGQQACWKMRKNCFKKLYFPFVLNTGYYAL